LAAGLVFNVFALLAVWIKHEEDKKTRAEKEKGDIQDIRAEQGSVADRPREERFRAS
jgi:hypothetical protein